MAVFTGKFQDVFIAETSRESSKICKLFAGAIFCETRCFFLVDPCYNFWMSRWTITILTRLLGEFSQRIFRIIQPSSFMMQQWKIHNAKITGNYYRKCLRNFSGNPWWVPGENCAFLDKFYFFNFFFARTFWIFFKYIEVILP